MADYIRLYGENGEGLVEIREGNEALIQQVKLVGELSGALKGLGGQAINSRSIAESQKISETYVNTLGQLEKAEKDAAKAALDRAKALKTEADATLQSAKAATESAKQKKILIDIATKEEAARKRESKSAEDLTNDYKILSKAYQDAALKYKNYALQLGEAHPITVQAQKDAQALDQTLKRLDANVGQNQRNVGNYASGYNALGFSIRNIAGELPNIGISLRTFVQSISNNIGPLSEAIAQARAQNKALIAEGKPTVSIGKQIASSLFSWQTAILAVVAAGVYLVDYLSKSSKATEEAQKKAEHYNDVLNQTAKSISDEVVGLQKLYDTATNTSLSYKERGDAVDELQKKYPEYLSNLNREDILNGKVSTSIDQITSNLIARAKATAQYNILLQRQQELTELQLKLDDTQNQNPNSFNYYDQNYVQGLRNQISLKQREVNIIQDSIQRTREQGQLSGFWLDQETKKQYEANQAKEKFLALMTEEERREYERNQKKKPPKPTDYTKETLKAENDVFKESAELTKQRIQEDIEANKLIYEDDKQSVSDRLLAWEFYVSDRKYQIEEVRKAEIDATKNTLSKIEELRGIKSKGGKLSPEQETLLLNENNYKIRLTRLKAEENAELAKIDREGAEGRIKITTDSAKKEYDGIVAKVNEIALVYQEEAEKELTILADQYGRGAISQEQYERQKVAIQNKYDKLRLDQTLNYLKSTVEQFKDQPEIYAALQKAITDAEKAASKERIDNATKEAEAKQQLYKKGEELQKELTDTFTFFYAAMTKKRMDDIDREIEKINIRGEAEVNSINQTGLTQEEKQKIIDEAFASTNDEQKANALALANIEEEKQRRIAEAEAKTQNQREALEQRKRILQRQSAQFEKSVTISEIIAETALAVVRALGSKPYTPANIALAAATGFIGAAQLARAIATPLPSYHDGTEFHPGGKAVMFEGNKPELVIEKGRAWIGSREGVYNLSRGAQVVSNENLIESLSRIAARQSLYMDSSNSNATDKILLDLLYSNKKGTEKLVRAMGNNRPIIQSGRNFGRGMSDYYANSNR